MLTAEGCAARRARLWASLPAPCDALVLTTPESLAYFAGYAPSPFVFNAVESSAALILVPGRSILIADNLVWAFLEKAHADEVVCIEWYTGKKSAPPRGLVLVEALRDRLPAAGASALGVEGNGRGHGIPWPAKPRILDPAIRALRRAKDEDELALIRRSIAAGEAGHAAALAGVRAGMTELDVFLMVQEAAARALGEPASVYGDFVSGPRCERERGGAPGRRVLRAGELFLLDFSVVVAGYRADFSNTFVVERDPSPPHAELYELCLEALKAGEAQLRPGTAAREVDQAVRQSFARTGMDRYFPSHSGHGLGLGHPEAPYLVPESCESLAPGDVVALEPGLYVPGTGGMRFEHNYRITDRGCERLTQHRLALGP